MVMTQEIYPVSIVTVKCKLPLFKGEEKAERIELIQLEEVGFDLVARKDLYQIGDKVVYIQPDYCLSDIPLFESFIRPNGDESKSMLGKIEGKPRRIRAKKFNMSVEPNGESVYSNGILLPISEVVQSFSEYWGKDLSLHLKELAEDLGITKYEQPEETVKGNTNVRGRKIEWVSGMYKTDEENIHNVWSKIEFPVTLVGTEKVDGSSVTLGFINGEKIICSRNIRKSLTVNKYIGRRKKTFLEKLLFWTNPDLNRYEEVPNTEDDFVKYSLPYLEAIQSLIDRGMDCRNIILRGELNGGKMKGSGNKNNPSSKLPVNIKFFGVDLLDSHFWEKGAYYYFNKTLEFLNDYSNREFTPVKEVFLKEFTSKEELMKECKDYFKKNMIEGIVVRTLDSKFSAKIMNDEYDSKK